MDEQEIRRIITETAHTTANEAMARYEAARQDLRASEGYITWKALTPGMRRRAGVIVAIVFLVGVLLGFLVERMWFSIV